MTPHFFKARYIQQTTLTPLQMAMITSDPSQFPASTTHQLSQSNQKNRRTNQHQSVITNPIISPTNQPPISFRH